MSGGWGVSHLTGKRLKNVVVQILIILPGLLAGTVHRVTQLYKTACREEQVRRERGKAPFCS